MREPIRRLNMRIKDSRLYRPAITREIYYLRDSVNYLRRAAGRLDAWKAVFERPFTLLGFDVADVCNSRCCYRAYLLDGHLDVLINGDVRLCGCRYGAEGKHDELVIGNVRERSLADIWFGDEARRLCERFLSSDAARVCFECSMYVPFASR